MNITIIANPHAGSGAGSEQLNLLQQICHQKNIDFQTYQTTGHRQLPKLMAQLLPSLSAEQPLVLIGGDGTLNEAIATLAAHQSTIPIAYLPSGTGNDFARQLNFTKDAEQFLEKLKERKLQQLEFIHYTERYSGLKGVALNSLGFGLDAEICVLNTSDSKKYKKNWGLNKLSYLTPVIQAFRSHKPFTAHVQLNNEATIDYDKLLLLGIFNHAYFGGGVKFVPQATQGSHSFDLALARDVSTTTILRAIPSILTGHHFERFPKNLIQQTATQALIKIDTPISMQTDGEVYFFDKIALEASLATYPIWITHV